jgi:hypothetical protein
MGKNYFTGAIIVGAVIFLVLALTPFWANFGGKGTLAKVESGVDLKNPEVNQCVEKKEWMRINHMQLLDKWRDDYVREGKQVYVSATVKDASGGAKKFDISLQNGCTKCHTSYDKFCLRCHTQLDATPKCWECHIKPQEQKTAQAQK